MNEMTMWPGISLEVDRPGRWVETLIAEADPAWRYKDAAGHGHFYDDGYPTLAWMPERCMMGHGDDCDAEGHWECPLCGEHVNPGTRLGNPVFISGPTSYQLTVQRGDLTIRYSGFGPDQLETVAAAIADAVQASLGEFTVEVRHAP